MPVSRKPTFANDLAQDEAWIAWTPTFVNFTKGNATIEAKYIQVGKYIHFKLKVVLGTTSSMGTNMTFTLPATSTAEIGTAGIATIGAGTIFIGSVFNAYCIAVSTTTASIYVLIATGSYATTGGLAAAVPGAWTTGSEFATAGTYEAA